MAGRYIPPHLRNKSQSEPKPAEASPPAKISKQLNANLTLADIDNYLWPVSEIGEGNDGGEHLHGSRTKTLRDSAPTPGKLACVILYWQANPKWESDHIIFTKSNLELLPQSLADKATDEFSTVNNESAGDRYTANGHHENVTNGVESATGPIAVFKRGPGTRKAHGFQFEGWFQIESIAFLEPKSDELIRMLEQKWTRADRKGNSVMEERSGENWERSLCLRWAVVKLAKDEKADQERGVPEIEQLPEKPQSPRQHRKSVNEMLAEMRLKDSAGNPDAASAPQNQSSE